MQHRIILRAAIGLTVVLLIASLMFGWASTFREQRLAAQAATAGPAQAYDAATAAAAYEDRCSMCHGPATESEWMPSHAAGAREAALFEYLQQHAKAPPAENRIIATLLAGTAQKNQ